MPSRRILLLLTDLQVGGTPTLVRELAVRLNAPPKVELEVACLAGEGPVVRQLAMARVHATPLDATGPRDWRTIARLRRLIRDRRFDTVLSFLVHANVAAAVAAGSLPGVRWLQSIQTTQPDPRWHWHAQQLAALACEKVIVNTPSALKAARQRAHIPPSKLVLIPNAIEPDAFVRTPRPINPNDIRIGFLGRLDPVKRVELLIQAVAILPRSFRLDIFGDGRERERLGILTHRLGVSDRVVFHGLVERAQLALDLIDLLVLPSKAEGFGLVLIEAMAAGVPVVGADSPGIRDVIDDGVTGLLFRPATPAALARVIRQTLDDQPARYRRIEAAKTAVRDRYTWASVLPRYRAVLGLGRSTPATWRRHKVSRECPVDGGSS